MYVLLLVSLIVTLLTYLEGNKKVQNGMLFGFIILTIVICIRDDYGNDYENYLDWYRSLERSHAGLSQVLSKNFLFGVDNGWTFLYYLTLPFGFRFFVALTSIFNSCVFFKFIKDNVLLQWRWYAVFVYLFSSQIFVLDLSMMRQAFVISLFLLLFNSYISKKKYILPLLLIWAATFVHSSAIILLPFVFICSVDFKKPKLLAIIICLFYLGSFFLAKKTESILNSLALMFSFERYADTYADHTLEFNLGLGYIIMQLPLLLYVIYLVKQKTTTKNYAMLFMASIPYFLLAFKAVPMSERIGYYFASFSIATIPLVVSSIKKAKIRYSVLSIHIVVTVYSYIAFFNSPIWADHFLHYKTIFD